MFCHTHCLNEGLFDLPCLATATSSSSTSLTMEEAKRQHALNLRGPRFGQSNHQFIPFSIHLPIGVVTVDTIYLWDKGIRRVPIGAVQNVALPVMLNVKRSCRADVALNHDWFR